MFLLGSTQSEKYADESYHIDDPNNYAYIYNMYYGYYIFAGDNYRDYYYIGSYLQDNDYYKLSFKVVNKEIYSTNILSEVFIRNELASMFINPEEPFLRPTDYRITVTDDKIDYSDSNLILLEAALIPIWTTNSFYLKCLNTDKPGNWVRAIPDTDWNGSKSLERTDSKMEPSTGGATTDRMWKIRSSR